MSLIAAAGLRQNRGLRRGTKRRVSSCRLLGRHVEVDDRLDLGTVSIIRRELDSPSRFVNNRERVESGPFVSGVGH